MDAIVPGGIARDVDAEAAAAMRAQSVELGREIGVLRGIYDEHAGLQDRFRQCGQVSAELAAKLGLTGFAARASGLGDDLRCDFPSPPYDTVPARRMTQSAGDVAARVAIRFDELFESLRLIEALLDAIPAGEIAVPIPEMPASGFALGAVEGWRGPVIIALETGANGTIRRCHPHDPSWQNWPVLEHAVIGNIVPDFPLINKSFNLSYSGHDL
jgi:Ni,Fe-hydrogenase III large subunit